MALQKGDFILIDYIAKVKETNEVFDTTKEDIAKKEHLQKEGEIYEPKLVVVGEGWVLKALDDSLTNMEVGKPQTVEIPADKAFGPRDPEKIRRVPLKQLLAKQINPTVGARIEFQGKMATVRSTGAGRVLLDYNPPLAGRTLIYDVTPTKKLEKNEEKIAALIHRRVPQVEENKFNLTIKNQDLAIDMPEETFYIEGIQIAKRGIAMDIQKFLPDIADIKFVETFKSAPKPAPAAPATSAPETEKAAKAPAKKPAAKPKKPKATPAKE
ncbi:MAG: peptidylprolyl isomerase [Candidatus Bathyarchaeota archaeon]|nr:peptidylprolyl isomerase [Candidatus Bathyarchaeota archaeon]